MENYDHKLTPFQIPEVYIKDETIENGCGGDDVPCSVNSKQFTR